MQVLKLGRLGLPAVAAIVLALGLLAAPATAQEAVGKQSDGAGGERAAAPRRAEQDPGPHHHPERAGRHAGAAAGPGLPRLPRGRPALDRRDRHRSACWSCSRCSISSEAASAPRLRESGVRILRFNALERFAHWLTATAFIVLGDHRPELRLRQAPADAADRRRTPSPRGRSGRSTRTTSSPGRSCSASW